MDLYLLRLKRIKILLLSLGTASQLWRLTKGTLINGELACWTSWVLGQMLLVWHKGQLGMLLCFLECHLNWGAQFLQRQSIFPHKHWNPFSWLWAEWHSTLYSECCTDIRWFIFTTPLCKNYPQFRDKKRKQLSEDSGWELFLIAKLLTFSFGQHDMTLQPD